MLVRRFPRCKPKSTRRSDKRERWGWRGGVERYGRNSDNLVDSRRAWRLSHDQSESRDSSRVVVVHGGKGSSSRDVEWVQTDRESKNQKPKVELFI